MKKIIEQRRREKEDELKAKQRVREQIQADKLARKAKQAGQPQEAAPAPPAPTEKRAPQDYSEVKLQIRLIDGKTLSQSFGAKEPLSAVRLYIEMNRTDGDGPFKLMTSFPRKVFSSDDYDKPLDTLGKSPASPTAPLIAPLLQVWPPLPPSSSPSPKSVQLLNILSISLFIYIYIYIWKVVYLQCGFRQLLM